MDFGYVSYNAFSNLLTAVLSGFASTVTVVPHLVQNFASSSSFSPHFEQKILNTT
jgi:hypothetical protein